MDPRPHRPARSVDGFLPSRSRATPLPRPTPMTPPAAAHRPAPQAKPVAAVRPAPTTPATPKKRSFFKRMVVGIGKFLLGIGIFILAFLAQSPAIGQVAIGIYAIAAIGWRISSRITFTMAVMALALVIFASIRSDVTLANTFALYVFLLLAVGTLTLWREVRSEI
ncbi:MAG TPA: hypothetical protein VK694_06110 [Verrucomicrobiae bacterium]|nr:hypothetical protein [Verrucomicrobiae bacterium]